MASYPQFIPQAGACMVSKNVLEGRGRIRWMLRETSKAPVDNGWRIFSHIDTSEYLADVANLKITDYNEVCAIEPALIGIWDFPVGADLQLDVDEGGIHIVDAVSGREVPRESFYVPPQHRLDQPLTTFPLPLPATDAIRGEQPAADIGGVILRYRCADEFASLARLVITRYRQYLESSEPLDGLRTRVGFSIYQLRQSGPAEYWITVSDYSAEDIVETTTDDLTFALWIEAAQVDATQRAGVVGEEVDLALGLMVTKAALTVIEKGRTDELVLERRAPTGEHDSGWLVRTAEKSILRNKQVEVIAGVMAGAGSYLLPYLALPIGCVVRVAGGRCLGITSAEGGELVAADGTGRGVQ